MTKDRIRELILEIKRGDFRYIKGILVERTGNDEYRVGRRKSLTLEDAVYWTHQWCEI